MDWFGLATDVKWMLEFEMAEREKETSPIPFLMNLETFRQNVDLIKSQLDKHI